MRPLCCICVSVGLQQQDSDCVLLWEKGLMLILKRREKKLQLMADSQQTVSHRKTLKILHKPPDDGEKENKCQRQNPILVPQSPECCEGRLNLWVNLRRF